MKKIDTLYKEIGNTYKDFLEPHVEHNANRDVACKLLIQKLVSLNTRDIAHDIKTAYARSQLGDLILHCRGKNYVSTLPQQFKDILDPSTESSKNYKSIITYFNELGEKFIQELRNIKETAKNRLENFKNEELLEALNAQPATINYNAQVINADGSFDKTQFVTPEGDVIPAHDYAKYEPPLKSEDDDTDDV